MEVRPNLALDTPGTIGRPSRPCIQKLHIDRWLSRGLAFHSPRATPRVVDHTHITGVFDILPDPSPTAQVEVSEIEEAMQKAQPQAAKPKDKDKGCQQQQKGKGKKKGGKRCRRSTAR